MNNLGKLKTKDRILITAIRMYNESGINGVTSRHIASEMGISHGNLDYHYPTKEALMLAIYDRIRDDASEMYTRQPGISSLEQFHQMIVDLEAFQYRYRFFNLDVLEIVRSFPELNKQIQETIIMRKQQTRELFEEALREGYVVFPDEDVMDRVLHTIRIILTFWLSQLEVISPYRFKQRGEMVNVIWNAVLPYLTESGRKEYERIIGGR